MAEASISSLFPQSQAPRATDAPSPAAAMASPKKAESRSPSKFESELKADSSDDAVAKTDKPAKAAAAKTARGKGAGQTLQPLRQAAAKNKQAVDSAPVVALLTGKLDRLSPASIPELVSGNEFVTSALGETDVEGFMTKPVPVKDLLESLGVPSSVTSEAEQLGLDLAAVVSPNELLRALGVDPQRVFAELKLLKDNLALDGVQGYMRRAATLQKGGAPEPSARPDPTQQDRLGRDADLARAAAEKLPRRSTPDLTLGDSLASNQPLKGGPQPAAAAAPQAAMSPAALAQLAPWQVAAGMTPAAAAQSVNSSPRAVTADTLAGPALAARMPAALGAGGLVDLDQAALQPTVAASPPGAERAASQDLGLAHGQATASATLSLAEPSGPTKNAPDAAGIATAAASAPKMHEASYDAFAWMGERLRGEDTIRLADVDAMPPAELAVPLTVAPAATATRDPAATLERLLGDLPVSQPAAVAQPQRLDAGALHSLQQARLTQPQAQVSTQLAQQVAAQGDQDEPKAVRSGESIWQMPTPAATKAPTPSAPQRVSIDELARVLTLDRATTGRDGETASGERRDEGRSSDSSSGFDPSRVIESLGAAAHARPKAGHVGSFTAHVAAPMPELTTQDRTAIMQQVMDRATFLAREGGGTVRLDLSSADLGSLELAVNVQNDRLDLRIITSSDRARDVMAGEMSRLRDALTVQNFQLGSVEVGVGRRGSDGGNAAFAAFQQNHASQQFGGGRDRRGRAETWEGDVSAMARGLRGIDAVRDARVPSYARTPVMPTADGRIAVRA